MAEINELAENKYSKWEWNYGNSPKFIYKKESFINNDKINIELHIKKGLIENINITSLILPLEKIENALIGCRYSYKEIKNKILNIDFINNMDIEEIVSCFF